MDMPVWLETEDCLFPDIELALQEPEGLLAIGGSLRPEVVLSAYMQGIFPWYSADQPILWWSPNPRAVLFPAQLHISHSLKKTLNSGNYRVTFDQAFLQVITACAAPRSNNTNPNNTGTWLTPEMIAAYHQLYQLGYAHSVEVWAADKLVGGLYGLAIDRVFFGESMFHHRRDASKVALVYLVNKLNTMNFQLIDCQQDTQHLRSLGASIIPRPQFKALLDNYCVDVATVPPWQNE